MKKIEIYPLMDDPTEAYIKAISKSKTADDLVKAIEPFSEICDEAYTLAKSMFDVDVVQMHKDWKKASKPQSEEWIHKFNSIFGKIIVPSKLVKASLLADTYHAPWGVAYIRMTELDAKKTKPKKK